MQILEWMGGEKRTVPPGGIGWVSSMFPEGTACWGKGVGPFGGERRFVLERERRVWRKGCRGFIFQSRPGRDSRPLP